MGRSGVEQGGAEVYTSIPTPCWQQPATPGSLQLQRPLPSNFWVAPIDFPLFWTKLMGDGDGKQANLSYSAILQAPSPGGEIVGLPPSPDRALGVLTGRSLAGGR